MRIFWAILVGALVFCIGRLVTNILTIDWFMASWLAAQTPPSPGNFLPTYDDRSVLRLMAIKLGILAFWSFVAAIVSGSIAPHRAYRCALILGILFIAEFVGMRWWVSWMVHPANFGMGLIHYLAATPEFITTFLFLFLGAALARRMRRDNPLPKAA